MNLRNHAFPATFFIIFTLILALFLRLIWLDIPDITADELHYMSDAIRLSTHDPYISIRHHPFQHPSPSIGHPFLYQIFSAALFKIVPPSSYSARLPSVLAGIGTIVLLFFFTQSLGGGVAHMAAFIFAILPFAVRFNRDAHLDSVFAFCVTLTALSLWRFGNTNEKRMRFFWLISAGVGIGLSLSTKLDGFIALLFGILVLPLFTQQKITTFEGMKELIRNTIMMLIPAGIIFLILNDPKAYFDGILHPSDPIYRLNTLNYWQLLLQTPSFAFQAFFYLLSPLVFFVWIVSLVYLVTHKSKTAWFLLIWQLITLIPIIFQMPIVDYGLLPLMTPIVLSVSFFLNFLNMRPFSQFLFLINILIFTFLFGLYILPLPYKPQHYAYNRTITDTYYKDVVEKINDTVSKNAKVYIANPSYLPLFNLRKDISWSYFGDPKTYDYYVVSEIVDIYSLNKETTPISYVIRNQDGEALKAFIYKNTNQQTDTAKESKLPQTHP